MFKPYHRLLAMLLCVFMLCTMSGFTYSDGGHDHDHEEAQFIVLAAPLTVRPLSAEGGNDASGTEEPAPAPDPVPDPEPTTAPPTQPTETPDTQTTPAPDAGGTQECPSSSNGKHNFQARDVDGHSVCPGIKGRELYCIYCGETRGIAEGTHLWGDWEGAGSSCTGYTQTRHCTRSGCSGQESRTIAASGHSWINKVIAATCNTEGKTWQECSVCHQQQSVTVIPATGHKAAADDGDCTTAVKCVRCGEVAIPAKSHSWSSSWEYDNVSHWHPCSNAGCTAKSGTEKHNGTLSNDCTRLSSCGTCGIKSSSSGLSHNFTGSYTRVNSSSHAIMCANPGCLMSTDNVPHVADSSTGTSCTEAVKCVCGYTITPAKGNHSYGGWSSSASGHSRTCTRCGYVDSATHTGNAKTDCTSAISCTTCGYVLSPGYSSHSFGVWLTQGVGGHTRVCTHPGCSTTQIAAHSGGSATCSSAAVCSVCGASYGSVAASTHTGATELRNARPAEKGVAGYTGDIYCLDCGKIISKGSTIKALAADHSHSYESAWKSDSLLHWHECSCGDRSGEAAHNFVNGRCSVCGAADPTYKKESAHVHSYGAWSSNGQDHWRQCSDCGQQADRSNHVMLNGKCIECGAVKVEITALSDVKADNPYYDALKRVIDTGVMSAVTGTQFKPEGQLERGMLADMLYRLAGRPEASSKNSFEDVAASEYFAQAISWVSENDLMEAADGETFGPNRAITFQELITFLWRYAQLAEYEVKDSHVKVLSSFAHQDDIDTWAEEAMAWAYEAGLIENIDEELLIPTAIITRAEAAAIIANFMDLFEILVDAPAENAAEDTALVPSTPAASPVSAKNV